MKLLKYLCAWLLAAWAFQTAIAQSVLDPARVDGGLIRGAPSDTPGVVLYKAVPFAAPPVGPHRWRAPQPVVGWEGVRESKDWPNRCHQLASANPPSTFYYNEFYWDPAKDPQDSEDCLYLNIWAPQQAAGNGRFPVMVFYHGGGNRHGNISEVEFNASRLAAKGIIVVTAAYRLNVMGFLALPGMPRGEAGNFAVLDTVESLKWVRRNISGLGGDPDNVTIAGQSAGSRNVRTLLSTPLARGLFRRAVMHSSPTVMVPPGKSNYQSLEEKSAAAAAMFQKHFPGMTVDDLRKLPASAFYRDALAEDLFRVSSGSYAALDGIVLTPESADLLRPGALQGVDVIVGTVADERTALDGAPDRTMDVAAFREAWKRQLGVELYASHGFERLYPAATPRDAWRQHMKAGADLLLEQNRIAGSVLRQRNPSSKVYVFYFDHAPPGRDREYYGSWHSSDLWYAMNSLRNEPGQRQWSPYDFQLADQVSSLWANFVRTGDPNGPGLPAWPQSTKANQGTYLWFAEHSTAATQASPYHGTVIEPRSALMHDYQMHLYGVDR